MKQNLLRAKTDGAYNKFEFVIYSFFITTGLLSYYPELPCFSDDEKFHSNDKKK